MTRDQIRQKFWADAWLCLIAQFGINSATATEVADKALRDFDERFPEKAKLSHEMREDGYVGKLLLED